ncbi:DUF72 domain-containing protein [Rufibacter quisquiliarum]|uniref:Uncharacterized protein YecE (DUF72 family) n=1 Tax=Rufibacter quisquiliarum TaxID=1549639 RepID=A0A839GCR8_9BACT|nr:DUF72 domain-containing protein [Rufibacter quisquiliarum]MBA9076170.1 uncharacterized protein YecE (DUF72 family) [Rufibacter quisquiliarum]
MDFGRLPNLNQVDFTLPPDHPATPQVLARSQRPTRPGLYLGCPTWTNKTWQGIYYPAGAQDTQLLHFYARQFNTLEMNTTHYRIPDARAIHKWRQAVPPGFVFCPKIPQVISHDQLLHHVGEPTKLFCDAILGLGDALGMAFLQLPPFFGPEDWPVLEQFLLQFPQEVPLAVEFRHENWFKESAVTQGAFQFLEERNITTVITDVAGRRDVLHMRLTTPVAMIRFNGHAKHPTDFTRLNDWADRLHQWLDQGLQTVYFFMHQPEVLDAPPTLVYLMEQLEKRTGIALPRPQKVQQFVQGQLF